MFIISKFISIFLSPLIWILLFLFFIWRIKNQKRKKYLTIVWMIFAFIFTNTFIANKCIEKYETPYQPLPAGKVYDCAIILAGVSGFDSFSRSLQLQSSAERLTEPVILYRRGVVKKLMICGGSGNVFPPYVKEAVYVKRFWMDLGVSEDDILVESESRNTSENARFAKKMLQKKAIGKNILLVTSALHMPRSKYIFTKMGVLTDCYPVDFRVGRIKQKNYDLTYYFVPRTSALETWESFIHEWVGFLAAKV